jgi:DivIVA domain-containing protein
VELDRRYITRRDFPAARRGYDPDEVDRHLRELADSVEDLRRRADRPPETSVAGAAAEQVRVIVEAAERSANEIEQRAHDDARRTRDEAEAEARAARERADADAAEHIRRVEEATRAMLQHAGAAESQVGELIDSLRQTAESMLQSLRTSADGMVSDLRTGAEQVGRELEEMRRGLDEVREARPAGGGLRDAEPGPARFGGQPDLDYGEPAQEHEQPEPYPAEPESFRPEPEPGPLKLQGDELHPGDVHVLGGEPEHAAHELPPAPEREPFQPAQEHEPAHDDAGPPDAEPEVVRETREVVEEAPRGGGGGAGGSEGARLIALNMALNGTPRDETAAYLAENFDLSDQDALLDEVYARAGS